MWRDSWSHAAHRAGGLGGGFLFWAGQAPGSRFGDQWLLLSRRRSITPVFAVTSSSKRAGSEKIITVPEIRSCRTSSKLGPTQAFRSVTIDAEARAFLVRPHQPRITRHIGGEDCGKARVWLRSLRRPPGADPDQQLVNFPIWE